MYPELKRKYGKCDFERFDHLSPLHASFGGGQIGKVKVDCRFRLEKSQWGVLGSEQNPAGIIYLDLDFDQPVDCRLKSATITVTLDDSYHDEPEVSYIDPRKSDDIPAQLTPWFGPQHLSEQPRSKLKTKRSQLAPHIETMGIIGAGGIGKDSEETFVQESRWNFSGRLLPGKRSCIYKTIKWELAENDLEAQPIHNNVIHTAFSFQHDGQPFLVKIEVDGKLRNMDDRVRHKFKKFSSSLTKDGGCATTLINFGGRGTFRKPLDELARGLKEAMEMEDLETAPVLIPNPQRVAFQEDKSAAERSTTSERHLDGLPEAYIHSANHLVGSTRPILEAPPSALSDLLAEQETNEVTSDPMAPNIANLAGAFAGLTSPSPVPLTSQTPPLSEDRMESEADDAYASKDIPDADGEKDIHEISHQFTEETLKGRRPSNPQVDLEAILVLLQLPGVLSVVQVIVAFLASCGVKLSSKEAETENKMEADSKITKKPVEDSKGTSKTVS